MSHKTIRFLGCVLLHLLLLCPSFLSWAQGEHEVMIHVQLLDATNQEPLPFASVAFQKGAKIWGATADKNGLAILKGIPEGETGLLRVRCVGYESHVQRVTALRTLSLRCALRPNTQLGEVVVTARESLKPVTAGIIGRQSINLLQPSTFADLLALLPGGMTSSPALAERNTIRLREASPPSSGNYNTTSLGTAFEIDGVPLNTDANLQSYTGNVWSKDNQRRAGGVMDMGGGVDMRGISTDDIEEVEILRGIPSVEHGNLISGLVRIKRKLQAMPPSVRIKADPKSKLFYVGSGFSWAEQKQVLNLSVDYLDSKISPMSNYENFRRLSLSARYLYEFTTTQYSGRWTQSVDYGGTFDNEKSDPELQKNELDRFSSSNNRLALSGSVSLKALSTATILSQMDWQYSLSAQRDDIQEQRYVSTVRINPLTTVTEGESDAFFAPRAYLAQMSVEGRPLYGFLKSTWRFIPLVGHRFIVGGEYSWSKNVGRGAVYDVTRPIDLGLSTRLRPLHAIPAEHKMAFFLEDRGRWNLADHSSLELIAGVRVQAMAAPKAYTIAWRPYVDPRLNIRYEQRLLSSDSPLILGVNAGVGLLSMLPSSAYLYPAPDYYDIVELNYYAAEEKHRRIHFRTYPLESANYNLQAPRNLKFELRADASWQGYLLSVTAFREDLKNGYRQMNRLVTFPYRKYDTSGIDPATLQGVPDLALLPFVPDTTLSLYGVTMNGSRTLKQGIEWQFSSPRIAALKSRFTCNGAFFLTRYENSAPFLDQPGVIVNGQSLPYVGIYRNDTGYTNSSLTTSVMMDTYIPSLNLLFATTFESHFFTKQTIDPQARIPIKYLDKGGNEYPFTEASLQDPMLKQLVRTGSSEATRTHMPFAGFINFKATKKFFSNRLGIALFVHRLISIEPLYERSGRTIRRSSTPYFGMELNLQL